MRAYFAEYDTRQLQEGPKVLTIRFTEEVSFGTVDTENVRDVFIPRCRVFSSSVRRTDVILRMSPFHMILIVSGDNIVTQTSTIK